MNYTITTDQKLELLIDFGADARTMTAIAAVMGSDSFDNLADDLIGEFTQEGKRYDLSDWAALTNALSGIFG